MDASPQLLPLVDASFLDGGQRLALHVVESLLVPDLLELLIALGDPLDARGTERPQVVDEPLRERLVRVVAVAFAVHDLILRRRGTTGCLSGSPARPRDHAGPGSGTKRGRPG